MCITHEFQGKHLLLHTCEQLIHCPSTGTLKFHSSKEIKGPGVIPAGELLDIQHPPQIVEADCGHLISGSFTRKWAESAASRGTFVSWCKSLFILCFLELKTWDTATNKVHSKGGLFPTTVLFAGTHFNLKHGGHRVNGCTSYKAQEPNLV